MAQILYLTGHSVTLYEAHRKGAKALGNFSCSDSGYSELVQQLNNGEPKPVAILVDLIEEEFREEMLPHVIGRDRSRLHTRHAKKLFRGTPFRYHRIIGRQREGRRDDQVLFSALSNRDNIEPLLTVLGAASVPVKGIYSLPLITERLLKALASKASNILIVTEQADGGLRETFIRGGRVHFSRLATINRGNPTDYCHIVTKEASKTRRYLISLKLLPPNQPLDIYVLCDNAQLEVLQHMTTDEDNITIHPVNLSHIAALLGFYEHPDTPFGDTLFCYLLQKKLTVNHYAPAPYLLHWRTYKTKSGLRTATWLIAVVAITMAGMNIVDSRLMEHETLQLSQFTIQASQEYQYATQDLEVDPTEALAMHEALQMADRLDAYPVSLEQLFALLGSSLSRQPNIVMDKFKWFVTSNPDEQNSTEVHQNNNSVQLIEAPFLVSTINAHLRNFNGHYRQAHDQINSIIRWIKSQPGVKSADIISEPLNTRTDAALQGGITTEGDKESAPFELRIVMELRRESA
ncbi:hypothetical protein MNBD_GAMMA13-1149 [hydrothermal vent metagenome]|uniref:GspL cytoplasmic actin-ATPase-like domain-containing protein n=1 Tax=hydrothermal vent metagenome TaxID=652676 RepID=A0A3B0Z5L3_9ZZZZ